MPAMARFCASQSKRSPPAQVVSRSAAYWGEIASRWKRGNRRTADRARCNSAQESGAGNRRGCEVLRSEEHTSELQSLMRISYAVFCLKKKTSNTQRQTNNKTELQRNRPTLIKH